MMAAVDLSEDDIERLLSSAELSLANKPAEHAVAAGGNQQGLLKPQAPFPSLDVVGKAGKKSASKQPELTLRVPQLKNKSKKAVPDNAGADWNYMPRTKIDDPKVKREFQLLRMRGIIDRKKFFKKESRKDPFPAYSQMGTLIEGGMEHRNGRLTRKERKRTLVEEVLATGEADGKFKDRYRKIQEKKTSGKKSHYKKLMARRKRG